MKSFLRSFALLSVAMIATAISAQAGYYNVQLGQKVSLGSCGGSLETNNGGNDVQLNVVVRGAKDCSNYSDNNGHSYKLNNGGGAYTLATVKDYNPGNYSVTITLQSNSGAHSDTVKVNFSVTGSSRESRESKELARSGTYNGQPVLAYFGGQSGADLQNRKDAICRYVGAKRAGSSYEKNAAYNGQVVLEMKNGSFNNRTIKDANQAFVFSSLKCVN